MKKIFQKEFMTGEHLRIKRVIARIPGHVVCKRACVSRGRLSEIECGHVSATSGELTRIDQAIDELIDVRRKIATFAAQFGSPFGELEAAGKTGRKKDAGSTMQ
jgi:hypothetical protein